MSTTEPVDHAAEAQRWFEVAESSHWPEHVERAKFHAAMAVHQSGAVVAALDRLTYEMRTANLIARAAIYVANNGQTFSEIEERLVTDDWHCTRCDSACERHRPATPTGEPK